MTTPVGCLLSEIPKNQSINILKDLIKEQKVPHLNHIDTPDLDLWKVSIPIDDLPRNPPTLGPVLQSHRQVSDMFPSTLHINHIHVVAFVDAMVNFYHKKGGRRDAVVSAFDDHDMPVRGVP